MNNQAMNRTAHEKMAVSRTVSLSRVRVRETELVTKKPTASHRRGERSITVIQPLLI